MQQTTLTKAYKDSEAELVRFFSMRLGSATAAADLAHDLFIKLQSVEEVAALQNPRAYLFRMAANLATDHLRGEKRRAELREESVEFEIGRVEELSPERHALARLELAHIQAAFEKLDTRCQRVFYMARFEEKLQTDIAKEMGISITTVYKDLKKAMATLRKAKSDLADGHPRISRLE